MRTLVLIVSALLLAGIWSAVRDPQPRENPPESSQLPPAPQPQPTPLTHVGRAACAACHPDELDAWNGSHHDLAMQEPSDATVLGDFSGLELERGPETFRFLRDPDRQPVVEVEGSGGSQTFPVRYLFGVTPLQQVLLERPGGRLQALPIAWATEAAEGGPRWFPLYPDETPPPGDPFHWSGLLHNYNFMCAECHSTAVTKGYDETTDRYETTWEEIDVSCEACHGPGSAHVAWASVKNDATDATDTIDAAKGFPVRLRRDPETRWVRAEGEPTAHREPPAVERPELDVCGRCHSRRSAIADGVVPGQPLLDTHRLELLRAGLYHVDGQILDEVYVLGSFLQSKMHAEGVTCSDCHDPHSGALRLEGNLLCIGCHEPVVFDVRAHHHHPDESSGTRCVECHMPTKIYMGVDPRRDHSFRVPRPDLSVQLGVPNPCVGCHAEKDNAWAAATVLDWFPVGRTGMRHWGHAFAEARSGISSGLEHPLLSISLDPGLPAIVRATALSELGRSSDPRVFLQAMAEGLWDPDPLVRQGALLGLPSAPPQLAPLLVEKLDDTIRVVRIEAARLLAPHLERVTPAQRMRAEAVLAEYRMTQTVNGERPEAHLNLGTLALDVGDSKGAEREFRKALEIEPAFGPAAVNLSDLYRMLDRDTDGIRILHETVVRSPEDAGLHHALGLALVRAGESAAAIDPLRRAAQLAPEDPRYAYVLAVALHDGGDLVGAFEALDRALRARPGDRMLIDLRNQYAGK